MYSFIRTSLVVACVALVPAVAIADTIQVGDSVRFLGSDGTLGGGAFHLDNLSNGVGEDFLTFCLQRSQYRLHHFRGWRHQQLRRRLRRQR